MVKRDEAWEAAHGASVETQSVSTASTSSAGASAAVKSHHGVPPPPPPFPPAHGVWPWHGPRGVHPPGPHGHHPPGPHGHHPPGPHGHHPPGPHGHHPPGPHGHHGHHGPHGHHGHHGHHGPHGHHGHHGPHGHHGHHGPHGHHGHHGHHGPRGHHGPHGHHENHGPWNGHPDANDAVEAAELAQEEYGTKGGKAKRQGRLMARFVKATPEEFVVLPGETLVQTWEVRNESGFSWPGHVELIFVGGDVALTEGVEMEDPFVQGGLPPGEVRTIVATLKAPPLPGRYEAVFRLRERVPDAKAQDGFRPGQKFGQRLWTAVRVTTNGVSGGSSGEEDEANPGIPAVQKARLARLRGKADQLRTKLAQVESRIHRIEQRLSMVD